MLRLLRCDEMQGYLFSKPLPFDEMTALLAEQIKTAAIAAVPRAKPKLGGRRQRLAHFLKGFHLDLADALGRDVELGGEVVQREGVLLAQPARLDDAAAARVQGW